MRCMHNTRTCSDVVQKKIKDRETRTLLKTGGELRCSGRVSSSCPTCGTHRVTLVINQVITRECYPSYKPGDNS